MDIEFEAKFLDINKDEIPKEVLIGEGCYEDNGDYRNIR